jgi:cytochrome c oxidase assembly protein subunit 15
VVPDLSDPLIRLHFAHRVLAAAVGVGLLALFAVTRRAAPPGARGLPSLALGLVLAQILLGALVIVLYVPVWAAVAHQALGVLTFAVISLVMWRALGAAAPAGGRARLELEGDVGLRRA